MSPTHAEDQTGPTFLGQPVALFVLVVTSACEHFAFFGVRGLVVFYFGDPIEGPAWEYTDALMLFSMYSIATYAAFIPGGFIADRVTGVRRAVILGGLSVFLGCALLALPETNSSYVGLVLVTLGIGLMRPALWTMVGRSYEAGGPRDSGFSVLYVTVNLGAALCGLSVISVGHELGWSYGFGVAAAALALGLGVYIGAGRYLPESTPRSRSALTSAEKRRALVVGLLTVVVGMTSATYGLSMGAFLDVAADHVDGWVGSLESIFVVLLAFPVAYIWAARNRGDHESSALLKMGQGSLLTGVGLALALPFVMTPHIGQSAFGVAWLAAPILVLALGSLFITPVVWSLVTKLAPAKYASTAMGAFFMGVSFLNAFFLFGVGEILGENGENAEPGDPVSLVIGGSIFCMILGASIIAARPALRRFMRDD